MSDHDIKSLKIHDSGLSEYRVILNLQQELIDKRRQNKIPDTVLPAVATSPNVPIARFIIC